jgi:dihydrofolate reductase
MTRTIYYTATSLDGYIADPDATLDWLLTREQDQAGALNYEEFIATIGSMAMGRTTYEWVLDHENGRWPYELPTWVFTHQDLTPVSDDVRIVSGDIAEHHAAMVEAAGGKDVWMVGGGDLAGLLADSGLLDEVIVYVAPVRVGAGAPLLPRRVELRLEEVAQNGAFACARYSVVGEPV